MTNKTPIAYYSKHKIPPRGQLTFWLEVPIREMCLGIYNTGATWNLQWILASAPSFMPGLPAVVPCTALDPWLCFGKRPKKPFVCKSSRDLYTDFCHPYWTLHWHVAPTVNCSGLFQGLILVVSPSEIADCMQRKALHPVLSSRPGLGPVCPRTAW